jgi:hypothetical protein
VLGACGADERLFLLVDGVAVCVELAFKDVVPVLKRCGCHLQIGEVSTHAAVQIVRKLVKDHVADLLVSGRFPDVSPGEHDARGVLRFARHLVFVRGDHAGLVLILAAYHESVGVDQNTHEIPICFRVVPHDQQASLRGDYEPHLVRHDQAVTPDESHVSHK